MPAMASEITTSVRVNPSLFFWFEDRYRLTVLIKRTAFQSGSTQRAMAFGTVNAHNESEKARGATGKTPSGLVIRARLPLAGDNLRPKFGRSDGFPEGHRRSCSFPL